MRRVTLDSSAIEAVTYDNRERTLIVEFRDGDSYRYRNVPEVIYKELLSAESAGAFWNHAKDHYSYERLD
jgi:hypothetical protein